MSAAAERTVQDRAGRATLRVIRYLSAARLRRALRAGIHRVMARQEHLNRINVFPVPDGDTGTNLAFTLKAVLQRAAGQQSDHVGESLTGMADAALDGARGNSGAIFAQFLQGFSDASERQEKLDSEGFAHALSEGAEYAQEAMAEPREGTILTVIRDFAHEVGEQIRSGVQDLVLLMERGVQRARQSLANTPKQLAVLQKAGVVDAGAQGFVDLLEGILEFIHSGTITDVNISIELPDAEISDDVTSDTLTHRFCTECVVTGESIDRRKLREGIMELGASSLVIAGGKQKLRIHVHVNSPDQVFRVCEQFGAVSSQKADDMRRQRATAHGSQRVAVLVDSGADIPDEEWERLGIHIVPVRLHFGERSYLDKVSLTPREFYEELASNPVHPKTSQPAPGDFRRQFQFLSSHHEAVVSINISGALSGTFQAAVGAASRVDGDKVHVVDSKNASVGQGLLAMYAAEAAAAGMNADEVLRVTGIMRPRTRTFAVIPDLSWGVRGGRVGRSKKLIADLFYLTPIMANTPEGTLKAGGVLFGKSRITARFATWLGKQLEPGKRYRLLVGHCNAGDAGRELRSRLSGLPGVDSVLLTDAGPAIGAHAGPGSLVVGIQEYLPPEDLV